MQCVQLLDVLALNFTSTSITSTSTAISTSSQTAAPCLLNSWFGQVPCAGTGVITITIGQLAILGIVGFIIGFVATIGAILFRHRYGIWTIELREVGLTYRQIHRKLRKPDVTEFTTKHDKKEYPHMIDLERTAFLDDWGRPVLFYLLDTITPLLEVDMTARLRKAVEQKRAEILKKFHAPKSMTLREDKRKPSEPFGIFFGRHGARFVIDAMVGKQGTGKQAIGLAIFVGLMLGIVGYFLGSIFPITQFTQQTAPHVSTTISTTVSSIINGTATTTTTTPVH